MPDDPAETDDMFPQTWFGEVGQVPDWRSDPDANDDPDDEDIEEASPYVIAALGFDTKDIPPDDEIADLDIDMKAILAKVNGPPRRRSA